MNGKCEDERFLQSNRCLFIVRWYHDLYDPRAPNNIEHYISRKHFFLFLLWKTVAFFSGKFFFIVKGVAGNRCRLQPLISPQPFCTCMDQSVAVLSSFDVIWHACSIDSIYMCIYQTNPTNSCSFHGYRNDTSAFTWIIILLFSI